MLTRRVRSVPKSFMTAVSWWTCLQDIRWIYQQVKLNRKSLGCLWCMISLTHTHWPPVLSQVPDCVGGWLTHTLPFSSLTLPKKEPTSPTATTPAECFRHVLINFLCLGALYCLHLLFGDEMHKDNPESYLEELRLSSCWYSFHLLC